ncbi:MAG: dTMP kinase [Acutalibacteraceae bacterium]
MGKLIVIEGLDGSGKSTQIAKIKDWLSSVGADFKQIKLPDYDDPSSTLVRMYLAGQFGVRPDDVNAYAASCFYAADRYASFKQHWKDDYDSGSIILADRYTTSNAVHQCSKLPENEWDGYLDWLYDFEFDKLQIPKPDLTVFLDMDIAVSQRLLSNRYNNDADKKDIHERDLDYLARCRKAAYYSADKLGWCKIKCDDGENPLPIDEIFGKIKTQIEELL